MNHKVDQKFWRRGACLGVILSVALLLSATPLFAADKGVKLVPAPKNLSLNSAPAIMGGGGYLFQFKVPVNISRAGDLEAHTGNSSMKVSCSVYPSGDTNYSQAGGRGEAPFQLSNHAYNGTINVNITAMEGSNLAHNMAKWRCVLLTKAANGSWSLPLLDQFDQPGSALSHTGNL